MGLRVQYCTRNFDLFSFMSYCNAKQSKPFGGRKEVEDTA